MKAQNVVSRRYGRLVVVSEGPSIVTSGSKKRQVWCECECGVKALVRLTQLQCGRTQSCGCLRADRVRAAKAKGKENGNREDDPA